MRHNHHRTVWRWTRRHYLCLMRQVETGELVCETAPCFDRLSVLLLPARVARLYTAMGRAAGRMQRSARGQRLTFRTEGGFYGS